MNSRRLLVVVLILFLTISCYSARQIVANPKLPAPEKPSSYIENVFRMRTIEGQNMYCAPVNEYMIFKSDYKRFMIDCYSCPGWEDGKPN